MDKIRKKLSRHGIASGFLLIAGMVLVSIQIFRYATNALGEWPLESAVFALAFLCIWKPVTLVNIIRKARGLETK